MGIGHVMGCSVTVTVAPRPGIVVVSPAIVTVVVKTMVDPGSNEITVEPACVIVA